MSDVVLREALYALTDAAREFSTEADYTVAEHVEDDFMAALEHAEKVCHEADVKPRQ